MQDTKKLSWAERKKLEAGMSLSAIEAARDNGPPKRQDVDSAAPTTETRTQKNKSSSRSVERSKTTPAANDVSRAQKNDGSKHRVQLSFDEKQVLEAVARSKRNYNIAIVCTALLFFTVGHFSDDIASAAENVDVEWSTSDLWNSMSLGSIFSSTQKPSTAWKSKNCATPQGQRRFDCFLRAAQKNNTWRQIKRDRHAGPSGFSLSSNKKMDKETLRRLLQQQRD